LPRLAETVRALALACAGLALGAAAHAQGGGPSSCFSAADNARARIEIYQQAPPPTPGRKARFAFFPATAFASQAMARLAQARHEPFALYYFQWANRSTAGVTNRQGEHIARKANFQPGSAGPRQERADFSSTDKADACTLAQTATALGLAPPIAEQYLGPAGVRAVKLAPDDRAGLAGASDVCILPSQALPPEAAGVLLDYEVQDGRTPAYTLAFLQRYAALAHSAQKRAILLINPLDAPSQDYTGVTQANANSIHRLFDRTTIFVWARNAQNSVARSLDKQWEILAAGGPVDPRRLIVNFELANTTTEEAASVRAFVDAHGLAGVMFWRDHAQQGGACDLPVNRKISCIAFGDCQAGG
jgi:hypothetical protein